MIKEGIINLLKPAGMTSHDGVQLLRRLTGIKRIGHTGTLDPMAVGVLPLCIGSAARITEYLDLDYKKYRCEMLLGIETDTQDVWGETLKDQRQNLKLVEADILKAIDSLRGEILQSPPSFSAVRVGGRRLYEYAREGNLIEAEKRRVYIKDISVIHMSIEKGSVTFDVECTKGTYVRTLCHEVGRMLGCGAAMSFLIRMESGRFKLENTTTIEELLSLRSGEDIRDEITGRYTNFARADIQGLNKLILEADYPLIHFGQATVNEERGKWFTNGGHLRMSEVKILREPKIDNPLGPEIIRKEYYGAYNIYLESSISDHKTGDFLGVAFYNDQYKKLVADKVFKR